MMKRLLVVAAVALCVCHASRAQNEISGTRSIERNAVSSANFTNGLGGSLFTSQPAFVSPFPSAVRPSVPFSSATFASPLGAAEPAPAAPDPRFVFGGRDDFRWQLALGLSFVRFRSTRYFASAVGISTSLTYFTNEWFALEGNIITAFAPTINVNEHVKWAEYGAGPKLAWRRAHFEPWMHALVGGAHVQPRVPNGGPNAVGFQTGGGLDYRLNPRFSVRLELDWISTHFWGQWQNSGQGALQGVIHF